MNFGGDHPAHGDGKISPRCIPKLPAMARLCPDVSPSCRPWQDCALMYPQAAGHGKISPRCVPEGASDKKNTGSWQYIAAMYSDSAYFGKICVLCIQKAPQSAVGECTARISCHQGAFSPSEALESCTAHESCHPLTDLSLPQRLANTCRLPCPLQSETSRRWASAAIIRRMACSPAKPRGTAGDVISTGRPTTECCAELGLDSRTVSKWAQNRRRGRRPGRSCVNAAENAHRKDESLLAEL